MDLNDDKHLAERMLSGDQRAFDEFFHGYFDRLFRFALVRLNNHADDAEDVVQQTLCRAMEKISLYRGESALFTWLSSVERRKPMRGPVLIVIPSGNSSLSGSCSTV